jgi:endonuclease-3
MAASSRTAQFTRLHKVLKKYYTPVAPDPNRSVLEHLLFATCLENAHYRVAEEMFAALVHTFFDWNEIRVSSVRELSEVVSSLPDPAAAGHRIKRILQNLFEATYSFDLEELRKQNLGPAVERLEKIDGTTKFSVAYVVQSALAGHAIPIDSGTANALYVVDMATDADVAAGVIPGLDRAIPKTSGVEYGSLVHQLGADFTASPYSPALHTILLEIDPGAKGRLPSRRGPKRPTPEPVAGASEDSDAVKAKSDGPEAKAARPKPGKAGSGDAKKEPANAHEAGPESAAAAKDARHEAALETKKKPGPVKRKPAAEEPPADADGPAAGQFAPKNVQDHAEDEPVADKRKQSLPAKKPSAKKRPEDTKERAVSDADPEPLGVEGISKRKPR